MQKIRGFEKQVFVKSTWTQTCNFTVNYELGFFFVKLKGLQKTVVFSQIFESYSKKRQKFRGKIRIMHFKTLWAEK